MAKENSSGEAKRNEERAKLRESLKPCFMAKGEPCLVTDIDRLLEMVKEFGEEKVPDAAKKFNVSESQIEGWGRILEEFGLIKMHYPPIGKPVLKKLK